MGTLFLIRSFALSSRITAHHADGARPSSRDPTHDLFTGCDIRRPHRHVSQTLFTAGGVRSLSLREPRLFSRAQSAGAWPDSFFGVALGDLDRRRVRRDGAGFTLNSNTLRWPDLSCGKAGPGRPRGEGGKRDGNSRPGDDLRLLHFCSDCAASGGR